MIGRKTDAVGWSALPITQRGGVPASVSETHENEKFVGCAYSGPFPPPSRLARSSTSVPPSARKAPIVPTLQRAG